MGRPVQADSEATRRRILDAALVLFAERGTGRTSIREIARGAGLSVAMAHHYFGSKEGLYRACIERMYEELGGLTVELRTAMAGASGTPADLMERAVRTGFRFARRHQAAVRLMQRSIIEQGEIDEAIRNDRVLPRLEQLSQLLGMLMGRDPPALRLPLQSATFLVVRYAISSRRELADFAGSLSRGEEDAERVVEDHLVAAVLALLGLTAANQR